jgi:hypothetical protein
MRGAGVRARSTPTLMFGSVAGASVGGLLIRPGLTVRLDALEGSCRFLRNSGWSNARGIA